ncbi:hypothetical protein OH76DRAFT_200104 [Lentinus brumalis]|uniref:Uncharacterized protein n=1 Tax=Lentinus brumalis TaxID=2498619 RepID=A0A371DI84_9APHY|nr:hypothetical protein OH76DRAFT_200104 [Polyporus brumalis]
MSLRHCTGARQLRRPRFLAIAAGANPILRVVFVLVLSPRRFLPRTIQSTLMRPHHHEHFPRPTSTTTSTPPTSTSTSTLVFLPSSTTSASGSSSQPGTIALTSSAAVVSAPSTTISPQTGSATPSLASNVSSSPAFKSTLSTAAIAGLSVAAVAIVAVILGLFIWRRRRCKAQIPHGAEGEDEEEGLHPDNGLSSNVITRSAPSQHVFTPAPVSENYDSPSFRRETIPPSHPGRIADMPIQALSPFLDPPTVKSNVFDSLRSSPSIESLPRHGRVASIDRSLAATSVPSNPRPPRADVLAASQRSSSDIATSPGEGRVRRESYFTVYELDGGVRLAGGPPDIGGGSGDEEEGPPIATLTLPPPYQRY